MVEPIRRPDIKAFGFQKTTTPAIEWVCWGFRCLKAFQLGCEMHTKYHEKKRISREKAQEKKYHEKKQEKGNITINAQETSPQLLPFNGVAGG